MTPNSANILKAYDGADGGREAQTKAGMVSSERQLTKAEPEGRESPVELEGRRSHVESRERGARVEPTGRWAEVE